ncbi:MAG: glycosyltransferase [Candidatus Latescibacteria bacterium]|nr:glycosyltransferase [Candidatus Latescibacterota bacterium]
MNRYNYVGCLREALSSLFAQPIQDFETVVVDDGSTDSTRGK